MIAGTVSLPALLAELGRERPVFYSEADMQLAFAWKLRELSSDIHVALETRPRGSSRLDIEAFGKTSGVRTAIELKYKTTPLAPEGELGDYALKHQSAHDFGRYDVVRDIERVETLVHDGRKFDNGFVVFLTNDKAYWERPSNPPTSKDRHFRLHEGSLLAGVLDWATPIASAKRRTPITLMGSYTAQWSEYSTQPRPPFRVLTFDVPGTSEAA